ncbi:hypothetical protein BDZ90DRAFT_234159 [Jaminaea rosea]|uniref:PCI domain-containing protein n=1 Tax=Jaminaea rosea TaxID=1569628 RepID=A0A316UJ47_9BASI|nr:hypothetical protein BDZ90DRAFT_234159 [Jaminaea rosea]PWN25312.1 hypothetical protein BDZ90DRAFT_234159 [Jaminaea rosea]
MEAYLASIDAAFSSSSTPSSHAFISLIVVTAQQHAALKDDFAAHRSVDQSMIAQRISRSNATMTGVLLDRTASLIEAALQYVADAPPIAILTDTNDRRRDQWLAKASLPAWQQAQAKWATVFNRSSALFSVSPTSPPVWFFPTFRLVSMLFLTLCIRLDRLSSPFAQSHSHRQPYLTECTSKLAGPVRAAGTDRTSLPGHETKRSAAMWLGNDCLRGYFKLNNLKLCETVLKSVREANNRNREHVNSTLETAPPSSQSSSSTFMSDDPHESIYPLSQQVTYRYYVGRLRISQGRIRDAFHDLSWALHYCHAQHGHRQIRSILLHLLPCALVLGMRPSRFVLSLLDQDVANLYLPLFALYAKPDIAAFEATLNVRQRKERLRKLNVYLMIRDKSAIGMWRGIVKRWWVLCHKAAKTGSDEHC